jgi:hypothetical protein
MGSFHLRIPNVGPGKEIFADMPPSIRAYISGGFRVLSKLPKQKWEEVKRVTVESIEEGRNVGEMDLMSRLDISKTEVRSLLAATSLFATLLLNRDERTEQLLEAGVEAKLLQADDKAAVFTFFESIERDREALKEAMEHSQISTEVLPSLLEFESTVDIRLGFEKGRLSFTAPIALVHLDTDARGQEIWLQLTKRHVEQIVKELQETLRKMDEAEKWAGLRNRGRE